MLAMIMTGWWAPEQEEAEGEEGGHREAGADHSPGVGGDCVAPPATLDLEWMFNMVTKLM